MVVSWSSTAQSHKPLPLSLKTQRHSHDSLQVPAPPVPWLLRRSAKGVEALKGIAHEWNDELGRLVRVGGALGPHGGGRVGLVDLVGGEVGDVDVGLELRLKGSLDAAQVLEHDAAEEGVLLDLLRSLAPETVGRVANEANFVKKRSVSGGWGTD